jgi:hypothetical protein
MFTAVGEVHAIIIIIIIINIIIIIVISSSTQHRPVWSVIEVPRSGMGPKRLLLPPRLSGVLGGHAPTATTAESLWKAVGTNGANELSKMPVW